MNNRPKVAIIGAGFGGLWAAKALAHKPVDVVLIDRENYHAFWPLLYQVAAAEVEPEGITYPVRSILHRTRNVHFFMTEVKEVDINTRTLHTTSGRIEYDFLVISTGSATNFYGVPGAPEYSFPLKTVDDGINLRNHILTCFERASNEPDEERRKRLLTFVIAGGGPTGVEYAGALSELIYHPLAKDYPNLDIREAKVIILEALDKLLPQQISCCNEYARQRLSKMGVEVRLGSAVSEVKPDAVVTKDGTVFPTETVVWTTGVSGDPNAKIWNLPTARGGRVPVLPTLQLQEHPEVYIVGDLAYLEQDGKPLPQIAPVAIQEGEHASKNILRHITDQPLEEFRYIDRGTMAVIGRGSAVAQFGERGFTGFLAWLLWLGVHLFKLIGFRNRILVMINWAIDYLFYEKNVRLILP